jgi:hypothetical protein
MRKAIMLFSWNSTRVVLFSFSAAILFTAGGCSNGSTAVPSGEVARTALEAALKSWCDGGKPGVLPGTEPRVEVHDTPWASGQSLTSFEILREEPGTVDKRFAVRLSLAKPDRVLEVEYHVLGVAPVMVFRDEDYERNINMVDGPSITQPKTNTRTPQRRR